MVTVYTLLLLMLPVLMPILPALAVRPLRRLEPLTGTLHCAGQESDTSQDESAAGGAFDRYSQFMGRAAAPAVRMWYTDLLHEFSTPGSGILWAKIVKAVLDNHTGSDLIVPQIGLHLPAGQELANVSSPAGATPIAVRLSLSV